MSVFVNQIIEELRTNPREWEQCEGDGVQKESVRIAYCFLGLSFFLPTAEVEINGDRMPLSCIDKFRVRAAVVRWYKNIPLAHLIGGSLKNVQSSI